jgi:hypothetical protein
VIGFQMSRGSPIATIYFILASLAIATTACSNTGSNAQAATAIYIELGSAPACDPMNYIRSFGSITRLTPVNVHQPLLKRLRFGEADLFRDDWGIIRFDDFTPRFANRPRDLPLQLSVTFWVPKNWTSRDLDESARLATQFTAWTENEPSRCSRIVDRVDFKLAVTHPGAQQD